MKNIIRLLLCFVIGLFLVLPANALPVVTERTETSLLSDVKNIHAGQKFWAVVHIKMQPHWHTYWKNPGDSGIPPTLLWTLPNGFAAGDIQYLAPDRLSVGPLVDYGYSNDAYYLVSITPPAILRDNTTAILALKAKWLVCNDICIPESADLSLVLPATAGTPEPSEDATLIADLVKKIPAPSTRTFGFAVEGSTVHFNMPLHEATADEIKEALFFPAIEGLITNASMQQVTITQGKVSFAIGKADGKLIDAETGLVSFFLKNGLRKDYDVQLKLGAVEEAAGASGESSQSIILTIIFAFIGGMILNLMPCVFPILSLKALAVAKKAAAHPKAVQLQSVVYTAGVVLSFMVMAVVLILVQRSGAVIGWGYQMQSPPFVAGLAVLLFVVGLNLSGYFEFPMLFGNVGGNVAKDSLLGSFLTGILAVLVATPCTAPFMAPAIGFALTQNATVILVVFAALGFGLAAPFLVIALFPKLVTALPKPGAWMLTFKQFLAFPMYLSSVWLVWVLTREAGANAAAIILISMIVITLVIWLWNRKAALAKAVSIIIVIVGFLAVGAILQPVSTSSQATLRARAEPFSQSKLDALRAANTPVFVDATADWCITCKVNETVALSSQNIMHAFSDHHVVYMVADWTHDDAEITKFLESFGRRGVPIYVYYGPAKAEPQVLPQVLTESTVLKAISQ